MEERTKRIAKNTLMLYIRTFITMIVGLYTGRIMLEALGIDNYGIQNVVGSIVGFSALITAALSAAGSRFITYSLGEGNIEKQKSVFTASFNIQVLLSLIIVVILEIAGIWFLNNEANIPSGRMFAANWVLQTSIIGLVLGLLSVPFNSTIIAHEKMGLYAYISIVEVSLNLVVVFITLNYSGDRLIFVSNLRLLCSVLIILFYVLYCRKCFPEVKHTGSIERTHLKKMISFSSWTFIGNGTWVFNTQGVNMLINTFFGVTYNAARGVAGTVNGCIQSFVGNFTTAFTPQITKSYACGDYDYSFMIVNRGTKASMLLQILFIAPVFTQASTILHIWLTEVPTYATIFLQFTLFESLVLSMSGNLIKLIRAHGKIKRVVLRTSLLSCLVFPVTWLMFRLGFPVWSSYPAMIIIYGSLIIIYLQEASRLTSYDWRRFVTHVIKPVSLSLVLSFILPVVLSLIIKDGIYSLFICTPFNLIWVSFIIYKCGLDNIEQSMLRNNLKLLFTYKIPILRTKQS